MTNPQQEKFNWIYEFPASVTVCDTSGIVLEMNRLAAESYHQWGGMKLVGNSLMDCHPEQARSRLLQLMELRQQNVYTIEKNGIHKMIFQSPWYHKGSYAGFVEISFIIPDQIPHFIRG